MLCNIWKRPPRRFVYLSASSCKKYWTAFHWTLEAWAREEPIQFKGRSIWIRFLVIWHWPWWRSVLYCKFNTTKILLTFNTNILTIYSGKITFTPRLMIICFTNKWFPFKKGLRCKFWKKKRGRHGGTQVIKNNTTDSSIFWIAARSHRWSPPMPYSSEVWCEGLRVCICLCWFSHSSVRGPWRACRCSESVSTADTHTSSHRRSPCRQLGTDSWERTQRTFQ